MGSLFDGIGGFPLAASIHGIKTLWASEIEPFPIAVTKLRFPDMIHVGDISKLNGAALPPVDIIAGGSPCQDLSVAGARAGLSGSRSGLFMEQIRVIGYKLSTEVMDGQLKFDTKLSITRTKIIQIRTTILLSTTPPIALSMLSHKSIIQSSYTRKTHQSSSYSIKQESQK